MGLEISSARATEARHEGWASWGIGRQKNKEKDDMRITKLKLMAAGLLAATFSALVANACPITVAVDCSGNLLNGVTVNILDCDGNLMATGVTGDGGVNGFTTVVIGIPGCAPCGNGTCFPFGITVCVDPNTLPSGVTLKKVCQSLTVPSTEGTGTEFEAQGCTTPPVLLCWETGGGEIASTGNGSKSGLIEWSFGGNIYPGCSPTAGGGGNLNIVNHLTGAHFKGENFTVVDCRGPATGSPKVTHNTIDWIGTGEVYGVAGLADGTPVTFVGTFQDLHESGAGFDGLYIAVTPVGSTTVIADFAIGTGPNALFLLSTGNVQIHQSSCGN